MKVSNHKLCSHPTYLKKYRVAIKPPKVGYRVSTVPSTRNQLQCRMTVGARFLCKSQGEEALITTPTPNPSEGRKRKLVGNKELITPGHPLPDTVLSLCCFSRALSQMAGRSCRREPLGRAQARAHTTTPRHDFFRMWPLWLLVLRMAQPLR